MLEPSVGFAPAGTEWRAYAWDRSCCPLPCLEGGELSDQAKLSPQNCNNPPYWDKYSSIMVAGLDVWSPTYPRDLGFYACI